MPFQSKKQQRFLAAHPEKLAKGNDKSGWGHFLEWAGHTDFKHLPEKKNGKTK